MSLMQVQVSNLKHQLTLLLQTLETYEKDVRDLYHELNQVESIWHDAHSEKFLEEIKNDRLDVEIMQEELKEITGVYNYFIKRYEEIGDKIFFDLELKNRTTQKIDSVLLTLQKTIRLYQNLDLSFCIEEKKFLDDEQQILIDDFNAIKSIKDVFKAKIKTIEEIEQNLKLKLSRIQIQYVKENDLNDYLGEI